MELSKKIKELVKELKNEYKSLSDFEAISIALKIEKNDIFKQAFVLSSGDNCPSALEKIAMHLEELKD